MKKGHSGVCGYKLTANSDSPRVYPPILKMVQSTAAKLCFDVLHNIAVLFIHHSSCFFNPLRSLVVCKGTPSMSKESIRVSSSPP